MESGEPSTSNGAYAAIAEQLRELRAEIDLSNRMQGVQSAIELAISEMRHDREKLDGYHRRLGTAEIKIGLVEEARIKGESRLEGSLFTLRAFGGVLGGGLMLLELWRALAGH